MSIIQQTSYMYAFRDGLLTGETKQGFKEVSFFIGGVCSQVTEATVLWDGAMRSDALSLSIRAGWCPGLSLCFHGSTFGYRDEKSVYMKCRTSQR